MNGTPRKRWFIHPGIQGTLVVRMLLQLVLFVAALALVSVLMQLLMDPLQDRETWQRQLTITLVSFGLVSFCLLPAFAWSLVKFSHRFVGPIVRLNGNIRRCEPDRIEKLVIRKSDFWQELVADYNDLLSRMEDARASAEQPTGHRIDADLASSLRD